MATVAEQWVLVEMVQALYEVSLAAPGVHDHTQPWGGGTFCVDFWSEAWAGLARLRPDPRRPSLERLIGGPISQWRNVGRHGREPEPGVSYCAAASAEPSPGPARIQERG